MNWIGAKAGQINQKSFHITKSGILQLIETQPIPLAD